MACVSQSTLLTLSTNQLHPLPSPHSQGVPCRFAVQTKAEIIPIQTVASGIPDPGNAGGGRGKTGILLPFAPATALLPIVKHGWLAIRRQGMNISEWLQLLWQQIEQTTWLEWAAVGFGVTEVLLAKANKIWLYPAGLISSACAIILLYEAGLFAECMLSFYYVIMSIYGWWHWHKRKNQPPVKVKPASKQDWAITAIISFGGWALLYVLLSRFTSSNVPILDAVVSSTAWAGTWLLSKRKIENWLVLNVSNIIAIPLLWYKHLPLMAMLTLFLFIVAVLGYFDWKKIYRKESKPANANISSHAAYPAV